MNKAPQSSQVIPRAKVGKRIELKWRVSLSDELPEWRRESTRGSERAPEGGRVTTDAGRAGGAGGQGTGRGTGTGEGLMSGMPRLAVAQIMAICMPGRDRCRRISAA